MVKNAGIEFDNEEILKKQMERDKKPEKKQN